MLVMAEDICESVEPALVCECARVRNSYRWTYLQSKLKTAFFVKGDHSTTAECYYHTFVATASTSLPRMNVVLPSSAGPFLTTEGTLYKMIMTMTRLLPRGQPADLKLCRAESGSTKQEGAVDKK